MDRHRDMCRRVTYPPLVCLAKMVGLVENVSEITKVTNYRGRSLASDEVCPEKTGVNAEK